MAISNGTTILGSDVNGIWTTALGTLRDRNDDNNPYKQFTETFEFNGVVSSTAEYLRTYVYTPRTDVVLRAARLYCLSTTAGIVATLRIPAQKIENATIVGGNIKSTLSTSASSNASIVDLSLSGGTINLPREQLFTFLAGDNIDIVVSSSSASTSNITVVLLFENILVP